MKATFLTVVLVVIALAMASLGAEPVAAPAGIHPPMHASDPVWMMLSGAALLSLASALRRLMP